MSFKDKIWRIYTGDYTDVGNKIGENLARQGKPKHYWGIVTNRNVMNYFWRNEHSTQTMKQSIDKSYDNVLFSQTLARTQANLLTPTKQGATMTAKDYNAMLIGLRTAKNGIELQIKNLETYLNAYDKKIADMLAENFLTNYVNKISSANGLERQIEVLKNILTAIDSELSVIQRKIEEDKTNAEK